MVRKCVQKKILASKKKRERRGMASAFLRQVKRRGGGEVK